MTGREARDVVAVLVHGGFLGPWIWADTAGYWEHADRVLTLPAGHCPQWSRPGLVADLLSTIITGVTRAL